jgi:hypothetical protein
VSKDNPQTAAEGPGPLTPEPQQAGVIAWQPITPGGVASFARASLANVYLFELLVSALASAAVFWFLYSVWFPDIRAAINRLPETGVIRGAALEWPGESPATLVDTRFLGVVIDAEETMATSLASDLRVHFLRDRVLACSLFGCIARPYPSQYIISLNRPEAEPWWGAWQPIILGIVAITVPLLLLFFWAALAAVYAPIAWLIAFFADRELTWGGSWRLASAALMPGAILLNAAVVAYGLKAVDLVRFLTLFGLHFVLGWAYLVISPFFLPRFSATPLAKAKNPFVAGPERDRTK